MCSVLPCFIEVLPTPSPQAVVLARAGAIKLAVEHRFRTYKAVFTIVGKRLPFRETTAFLDQTAPGVVAEFFAVDQFAGVAAVQLAAGSLYALA